MMHVRTLSTEGSATDVYVRAYIKGDGSLLLDKDRDGSGWHALSVSIEGPRGGLAAHLSLHSGQARDLARKLIRAAAFIDAREKGNAGPCLCTAWSHNLYDCPNVAALDYNMCRECWTPERGQQDLAMGHGEPKRNPFELDGEQ